MAPFGDYGISDDGGDREWGNIKGRAGRFLLVVSPGATPDVNGDMNLLQQAGVRVSQPQVWRGGQRATPPAVSLYARTQVKQSS